MHRDELSRFCSCLQRTRRSNRQALNNNLRLDESNTPGCSIPKFLGRLSTDAELKLDLSSWERLTRHWCYLVVAIKSQCVSLTRHPSPSAFVTYVNTCPYSRAFFAERESVPYVSMPLQPLLKRSCIGMWDWVLLKPYRNRTAMSGRLPRSIKPHTNNSIETMYDWFLPNSLSGSWAIEYYLITCLKEEHCVHFKESLRTTPPKTSLVVSNSVEQSQALINWFGKDLMTL